jgi:hypothetical protein
MQDTSPQITNLDISDAISDAAPSGGNCPVLESLEPSSSTPSNRQASLDDIKLRAVAAAANSILPGTTEPSTTEPSTTEPSTTEPSITEPSSVISSSTKRSFSERDATSDSRSSQSEAYQLVKRLKLALNAYEETISSLRDAQKSMSSTLDRLSPLHGLIPDIGVQPGFDTIEVAVDGVGDESSDDSSSTRSSTDDTESEAELSNSQSQDLQHRSTQRRKWTKVEEERLQLFKTLQKRVGSPLDCDIAKTLNRTENGVRQHWGIMQLKNKGKRKRPVGQHSRE